MPPGTLPTLWQRRRALRRGYLSGYAGYYLTGDGGYVDEDGYLYVMGRTDDVLNVAGHRLSTGSLEAALAGHQAVAECAVIGVPTTSRARCRAGSSCSSPGSTPRPRASGSARELVQRVRDEVGAVAACTRSTSWRAAQDPLGQDPAQDDARDRRRQDPDGARHDRGRRGARGPRLGAAPRRLTAAEARGAGRPGGRRPDGRRMPGRRPPSAVAVLPRRHPTSAVKSRVKWAWSYHP